MSETRKYIDLDPLIIRMIKIREKLDRIELIRDVRNREKYIPREHCKGGGKNERNMVR